MKEPPFRPTASFCKNSGLYLQEKRRRQEIKKGGPRDVAEAAELLNQHLKDRLNFIAHLERREYWNGEAFVPFEIRYYQHPFILTPEQTKFLEKWLTLSPKKIEFKNEGRASLDIVFLLAGEKVPAEYVKHRAIPGKDLWPKSVRLECIPEELKSGGLSTLERFKALLDAAKIHYEKKHGLISGMTDAPEAWTFDHPLELRVRDAVAVFPELKMEGLRADEFMRFTEYPFNEDWVFEFTCRLPLDGK